MSPTSYISRIASNANPPLSVVVQKHAIKLLEKLNDSRAGKDPIALAAAALYYVCKLKNMEHTQRILGLAAGISEVTIRNRINDMKEQIYQKEDEVKVE
jgi:transcription initiation factor TFIIB